MRFKAQIQDILTFSKFVTSLSALGTAAWVRLEEQNVRFTIIPESGTQVWAVLTVESIFSAYSVQSAANNVINLEIPLGLLQRALKSAHNATSASIRLTKKDNMPLLSLTINDGTIGNSHFPATSSTHPDANPTPVDTFGENGDADYQETVITQDVPIRILPQSQVDGLHEPECRETDVHIQLPPLAQIKSVSDRFTKLAVAAKSSKSTFHATTPRLELSANMHGCLKIRVQTEAMTISSLWTGLLNPELDPDQIEGGEEGLLQHPSTRMRALGNAEGTSNEGWATVSIDGRDWGRVLSAGRLGGRVIACFCDDFALVLYVYIPNGGSGEDSVITYYVSSYHT